MPAWLQEISGQRHKHRKSNNKQLILAEGSGKYRMIQNMLRQFIPEGQKDLADLEYMRRDLYEQSLEIQETARVKKEKLPQLDRWSPEEAREQYFAAIERIDLEKRTELRKIVMAFAKQLRHARISHTALKELYEVDTSPLVVTNGFRPDRLVTMKGEKIIDYTGIETYMEDENFLILLKELGLVRSITNQKKTYSLDGRTIDATSFLIRAHIIVFLNRQGFDPPLTAKQYTTLYDFFLTKRWIPIATGSVNMCPGPISIQYYNCELGKKSSVVISCTSGSECEGVPRSFEDYYFSLQRNQKNQD